MSDDSISDKSCEFLTLAGPGNAQLRVLGSRFLALARPITSEQEAMQHVSQRVREYHDATHHCFAFILGPDRHEQSSEAGEPRGTAGLPILRAIEAAKLTNTLVIVTRYFGGKKLGKGNLARAYGTCAGEALRTAPKKTIRQAQRLRVKIPTSEMGKLYALSHRRKWEIAGRESEEEGLFEVRVPFSDTEIAMQRIMDATSGQARITEEGLWTSS
ncbi:MAG: YigZ family protein [Calditrichaeota bacterium]|nr:YigZ family protein [Calditrichota bacterium]